MLNITNLPAPRLQLRWTVEPDRGSQYRFHCYYELVLPLRAHDCRGEVYDDDGKLVETRSEQVLLISETRRNGSEPCYERDGGGYFDAPFRDGAHAMWDAEVLGNPPIYAIALDGAAFKKPDATISEGTV
jgi:hypothetical protein